MGFDDDFDDEFEDDFDSEESGFDDVESQNTDELEETEGFFDPLDITDPKNAYLFLSDDAQEEIMKRKATKINMSLLIITD